MCKNEQVAMHEMVAKLENCCTYNTSKANHYLSDMKVTEDTSVVDHKDKGFQKATLVS